MRGTDFEGQWRQLSEEAITGIKEWRLQHPRATFKEIEGAIDEQLAKIRARMLQDAALASEQADWTDAPSAERPRCPRCDRALRSEGTQTRQIQTQGGHEVVLRRKYGTCPECGAGFFPLG